MHQTMNLKDIVTNYSNFPKEGIIFRDFGPLLKDPSTISEITKQFFEHFHPNDIDIIAGIEARGFILASLLASKYEKGMLMIRKKGKIPGKTIKVSYDIEYGKDTIEIQDGIIQKGQRVLICDDLIATGGTAEAAARLISDVGGKVTGFAFIIELTGLHGAKRLNNHNYKSLIKY